MKMNRILRILKMIMIHSCEKKNKKKNEKKNKKKKPSGATRIPGRTWDEGEEIKMQEYISSPNIPTSTPAPVPVAFAVPVPTSGNDAMARLRKLKQMKNVLHPDIYKKVEAEIMATICCQTRCDVQYNLSDDLTHTVSFDTDEDEDEEEKMSGTIPATGDEGVPPTPVVAIVVPTMPNYMKDAMTRLYKLERMRDNLHPEIYEKVKAEIMATV